MEALGKDQHLICMRKLLQGAGLEECSGIQKLGTLDLVFFFKGWTLSMLFRRMERMNYLLKIVISIVAVCTIHPGVWMFSSLLS